MNLFRTIRLFARISRYGNYSGKKPYRSEYLALRFLPTTRDSFLQTDLLMGMKYFLPLAAKMDVRQVVLPTVTVTGILPHPPGRTLGTLLSGTGT